MKDEKHANTNGVQGEGDYKSARVYKRDIDNFIRDKDKEIPEMAKTAEKAINSQEGAELKRAEEKAKAKARH